MQGTPRTLQTRADFDLAISQALSGEMDCLGVAEHLRGLIESSRSYVYDRDLAQGEPLDGAPPDYWLEEITEPTLIRRQLKRVTDPAARLFSLGYSISDVEGLINELTKEPI